MSFVKLLPLPRPITAPPIRDSGRVHGVPEDWPQREAVELCPYWRAEVRFDADLARAIALFEEGQLSVWDATVCPLDHFLPITVIEDL
jgi:hypothetical protein